MCMARLVRNGAIGGVAAGAALGVVLILLGENPIGRAVRLEAARHPAGAHDEMFSRSTQHVGGVFGALVYGLLLGLVFAVAFGALRHRIPASTDFRRSVTLAAAGWAAVVVIPFLLYPPNPPGVGEPSTITRRTVAYLLAVAWGAVGVAAAVRLGRQLRRLGRSEAVSAAAPAVLLVALVVLAALVLPSSEPVRGLPADLLWRFRTTSLAGTTACWATLAVVFGALPVAVDHEREREAAHA